MLTLKDDKHFYGIYAMTPSLAETPEEQLIKMLKKRGLELNVRQIIKPVKNKGLYVRAFTELEKFCNGEGIRLRVVDAESGVINCEKVTDGTSQHRVVRLVRHGIR